MMSVRLECIAALMPVTMLALSGCGGAAGSTPPPPPPVQSLAITSSFPPNGTVQTPYGGNGFSVAASGGKAPYAWGWAAASGSSLPPGLTLSAAGLLAGTPTEAGTYSVMVTVTDSEATPAHANANYAITIAPASHPGSAAPNGIVGQTYGEIITIYEDHCAATFKGWSPNLGTQWSWSAAPGSSLPPGLNIGKETYTCGGSDRCCVTVTSPPLLEGVPARAGTYDVIVTIGGSSTNYTIAIAAATNAAVATNEMREMSQSSPHVHYKLVDLGTLGGPQSYLNAPNNYAAVLNDEGIITGWADTSAPDAYPAFCFNEEQPCFISHAFQWQNSVITDLGALPGGGSSATTWISPNGLIAGFSEIKQTDPSVPGLPEVRAVLWKNRQIVDLGLLPGGGYESLANAVNSRGQVVGGATNTVTDYLSLFGGTETRAFLWQNGAMLDLGTLGGADSVALLVNEAGQVVGESYLNDTPSAYCASLDLPIASGAFLWENGKMTNLGSFGGSCTFASDLNDNGEVVGLSTLYGDQYQHAFLWRKGLLIELGNGLGGHNAAGLALNNSGNVVGWASLLGDKYIHAALWKNGSMTDLGALAGDPCSLAFSSNASDQIVGISVPSCDFGQARGFLWESGFILDLNALLSSLSTLYLAAPETINKRGEIAGTGFDAQGNQHAFLLIPCDQNHPSIEGCDYSPVDVATATLSLSASPIAAPLTPGGVGANAQLRPFARNRGRRLGSLLTQPWHR